MAGVDPNDHSRRLVDISGLAMLMSPAVRRWLRNEPEARSRKRLIFLQTQCNPNDVGTIRLQRDGAAAVIEDERRLLCKYGYRDKEDQKTKADANSIRNYFQ